MQIVKLAVCIPTYNRPGVVAEFIEEYSQEYIKHNFDIYVYDSSEDEQTKSVVEEWMQQYKNLYYIRIDPQIHSNMKVYNIFKEFGSSPKYDYLWVCSDSIRWTSRVLDAISHRMEQGYDIIIPDYRDVENIGNKEYQNANALFLDCAWHMTLYGATILKTTTMLRNVDWEMLVEKYAVPECINYSHVAFYFEKLYKMHSWRAVHLSFSGRDLTSSRLKKYPGWQKETFYVMCHCWPSMINKLPEYYKNKKSVIKKNGVNSGFLTYPYFCYLREQGVLNIDIYRCYRKKWSELTDVPPVVILILSMLPVRLVKYLVRRDLILWQLIQHIVKKRMSRYCNKFDKIYIYGAGMKAKKYTTYLNKLNIEFEAYLVSAQPDDNKIMEGHKVIPYYASIIENEKTGILLALNEENTKEVLANTLNGVASSRIFNEYNITILKILYFLKGKLV